MTLLSVAALVAAACGGGSEEVESVAQGVAEEAGAAAEPEAASIAVEAEEEVVLASGMLVLPAAQAFGDAGFHEVLTAQTTLPDGVVEAGSRVVLRLRDLTRPGQTCGSEHPLSGCATVDWSDFEGRPGVPEGGAFRQRLTLALSDGPRDFFLSEDGDLASAPDAYAPG